MFGYVKPYKPDMLVKEFELYKSVYCGLCRQLGKDYGIFARFILSYDSTFFALICAGVCTDAPAPVIERKCCTCNPFKRCNYCSSSGGSLEKAAAFSVISFYYKLKDTVADEGFFKSLLAKIASFPASWWRKRAAKSYPQMDRIVADMLKNQAETEKIENCSIDRAADPTAVMLSEIMKLMAKSEADSAVYSQFGYFLGRWVYIIDAIDDFDKDKNSGSFNPIVSRFSDREDITLEDESVKSYCNGLLNQTAARLAAAYNLMNIQHFGSITEHIVNTGMPEMQRRVIFDRNNNHKNSKIEV